MERQYIVSERAHLMCPNMHFAICADIGAPLSEERVNETLNALKKAHPFLESLIAFEKGTGRPYYDASADAFIKCSVKQDRERLFDDYAELNAEGWDATSEALMRVLLYPGQSGFTIVLVAHHLLCDGRGLMGLVMEFADHYAAGKQPQYAPERLPRSVSDLPEGSELPFISRLLIKRANQSWAREGRRVSYPEYLEFEKRFIKDNPMAFETEVTEPERVDELAALCKREGVTVNDHLIAGTMCGEGTPSVIIAADIRDKLPCYREGALGNYATAISIASRLNTEDVMAKARDVAKTVKARLSDNRGLMLVLACYFMMTPELIDAVAISTLGGYPSKAGRFVGEKMFGFGRRAGHGVTNLGRMSNKNILDAMFIPPFSPANTMMSGVLTTNGRMRICTVRMAGK